MRLLIAAVAALALSSCTSIDQPVGRDMRKICSAAATAHVAFIAIAVVGNLPASTVRKERLAWDALEPLCENPDETTPADVIVAALAAYATISTALKDAR